MRIELPVCEGRLVRRYKRFLADVLLPDGRTLTAHCPNPGSMLGCLPPDARVTLRDHGRAHPTRKLRYTLQAIEVEGTWVNIDTGLANPLVAEAIEAGAIPELSWEIDHGARLLREVRVGERSRLDLALEYGGARTLIEVKSTTLAVDRVALFPDARTERGRRHLAELEAAVSRGERALLFLCVGREDVEAFSPADAIDPDWGEALRSAVSVGVEVLAYSTRVSPQELRVGSWLPLWL
jgi:sugar fermentation stimulation protein A